MKRIDASAVAFMCGYSIGLLLMTSFFGMSDHMASGLFVSTLLAIVAFCLINRKHCA